MSARNKKNLKLMAAAIIVTLSSVFLPTMGAYADIIGSGEEKAKNYLYAAAAYECIAHAQRGGTDLNFFNDTVFYGQNISSIFNSNFTNGVFNGWSIDDSYNKVFIGKWLGDSDGNISCIDAIDKAASLRLNNDNSRITAEEISEGLLKDIYSEVSTPISYLYCHYPIFDSEGLDPIIQPDPDGSGWNLAVKYQWPQGYYYKADGSIVDKTRTPIIGFLIGQNGEFRGLYKHFGEDPDLNPSLEGYISQAWPASGANVNDQASLVSACQTAMKDPTEDATLPVFAYQNSNGQGLYANIRYTTSGSYTGSEAHRNAAIFSDDFTTAGGDTIDALWGDAGQLSGGDSAATSAELSQSSYNALSKLKGNMERLFFDGNSSANYLNQHSELKYIIIGRYLFNGDSGFANGCGGYSISTEDPNYESRDMNAWTGSVLIDAYTGVTGTTKTTFLTKFNNNQDFSWGPGIGTRSCSSFAEEFDGVIANVASARNAVYGYINPAPVNADGSVTPYNPGPTGAPETTEINCYTNAGALGWILCPIVESGGQFVEDVYDKFIEPQLVLDSGFFNRSNQGGEETYQAWQTFRNLANIAFVAVFLFVIFSQLTGFGIDNYGIKKLLPKMIIAAIIVNASYIICQIAIDAANIIGYGIKNIMGGIGTVPSDTEFAIREGGHTLASIGSNVGIAAIVAALTVPAVLGQGVGILITVFTALIGIVVAILTLFVVLAARKALSLVLVVISPLAFLCYMLPNTKKLFSKWLNALKGTLLAFPICAGMVFGGQAVSRIVMLTSGESSGTFFLTLIAAATAVAPIFLIPSVLKKSMGAISTVIDRASHGISRFGKERWRGSRVAKSWEKEGNLRRAAMQSDFDYRRAQRRIEAAKDRQPTSFAGRRALLNAHNTVASYDKELTQGYAYQMENASPDAAAVQLHNSTKGGKIDFNAASTALNRIGKLDQGRALEELEKFSDSDAFKNMGEEERNRFINMLNSQQGNTVAKAWAKVLGSKRENIKLEDAIKDPEYIAKQISGMGKDIVANTDKDVLRYMSGESYRNGDRTAFSETLSNAFTNEQMSTALSSGTISGKQETYFSNVITRRDAGKVEDDLRLLTNEQVAVANDNGIAAAARKIGDDKVRDVLGQKVMDISDNEQLASKLSDRKKENFYKTSGGQKRLTTSIDGPIK